MMLDAVSTGYLIDPHCVVARPLRVHSSFQHVLNLTDDAGGWLTLLPASAHNQPRAIRVDVPDALDWRRMAAHGMPVTWFGPMLLGPNWGVRLHQAPIWQPRFPQWLASQRAALSDLAHGIALDLLASVIRDAMHMAPAPTALQRWDAAIHAAAPLDADAAHALIGRGQGLTPDGDDYLIGYLAALEIDEATSGAADHANAIRQAIAAHLHRTTRISGNYLQQAVTGHFSESIDDLRCAVLRQAEPVAIRRAAASVIAHGATSGLSTARGFLHGLRLFAASPQPA